MTDDSPDDSPDDSTDDPAERPGSKPGPDPDSDVLALVSRGDVVGALKILMERHGTAIYRYCREALRDADLAEDVQQQVFIEAHRDLPRFRGRSSLRTWLFGIARNRVLDGAKARQRARTRYAELAEEAAVTGDTTSAGFPDADLRIAVQKAMGRLDDWQRSLVRLRLQANLPFAEIAAQSGRRTETVQRDFARTLRVLREMLREDLAPDDAGRNRRETSEVMGRQLSGPHLRAVLTGYAPPSTGPSLRPSSPLPQVEPDADRSGQPQPFESIGELRAAHAQLGERRRAEGESASFLGDAEDFVKRGCATGVFLDDADERWSVQGVLDYWAAALERAGWKRPESSLTAFDIQRAPALPDEDCPYRGLDAFEEKDSRLFFGREVMVDRLTEQLEQHRLVALVGPSGCGKSSLALAGMVGRARQRVPAGQAPWRDLPPMVPGTRPHDALVRLLAESGVSHAADAAPVLLVVDQLEELFTMCDSEAQREWFVSELLAMVSSPAPHRVVLTMRSDFESFVARYPALYEHYTRGRLAITPMSAAELRQAIEGPAALVGLVFETGVIDRLLQDVLGEPAGLPLLQFTLRRLWDDRRRNRVTRASYDRVGGGRQALALAADAVYAAMIPEDQRTARRILLRVGLAVDPRYELTRTRVPRSQFHGRGDDPARVDRVLDKLIEARLLRVTAYPDSPEPGIEVAHEALVRNWPRLAEWLREAQANLLERRRLDARVEDWIARGRGFAGVLDQVEIAEAQRWMGSEAALQLGVRDDLRALVAASQRQLEQSQRDAEQARQLAEEARRLAEQTRQLSEQTRQLSEQNAQLQGSALQEQARALVVAGRPMQALPYLLEARAMGSQSAALQMLFAQAAPAVPVATFAATPAPIRHAAFSPDGADVLSSDGVTLRIASAGTTEARLELPLGAANVWATMMRADEIVVIAAHPAPAVHVFELSADRSRAERRARIALAGPDEVTAAALSADGHYAMTADARDEIWLWDTHAGSVLARLRGHHAAIHGAAFSADGRWLVTASRDRTARIWGTQPSARAAPVLEHPDAVYSAEFSPDGGRVVTGCADGVARIWEAHRGAPAAPPLAHGGAVRTATFSPDGTHVVTGADDHMAHMWDVATGAPVAIALEHPGAVQAAVFHPDGKRVLTAGSDRRTRLWIPTQPPSSIALAQTGVEAAVLSPDGARVLTVSTDNATRIWDAASGAPMSPLQQHDATRAEVAFKRDAHRAPVGSIAFGPDGQRLITVALDGTARIWELPLHHGSLEDWRAIASCSPFALVDGVLAANPDPRPLLSPTT